MIILGMCISEGREGEVLELSQINDIKHGELPRDARNVIIIAVISFIIIIIVISIIIISIIMVNSSSPKSQ
jgi:hypothetical protein